MLKLGKKGISSGAASLIIIALLAVVVIQYTELYDFGKLMPKEVVIEEPVVFCDPTAGITVKLDAKDPWGARTVSGNNKYKILDGGESALSSVADAGTFSAPANSDLDIWFQLDSTNHYTFEMKGKDVKCVSPLTITQDVMPEGNFTAYLYDTDDENQISNITGATPVYNQTLTANKIRKLRFRVDQESERYTSHSTIVCYANNTNFDEIALLDSAGSKLPTAALPDSYSGTTGLDEWSYAFPALGSNEEWSGFIMMDSDDSNDPGAGGALTNLDSAVWCKWYDTDCVEIDDAPYIACGVTEDPDDGTTDVGDSNLLMMFHYD